MAHVSVEILVTCTADRLELWMPPRFALSERLERGVRQAVDLRQVPAGRQEPFYQEMSSETTQNMKVAGSDIKNVQKQTFYFSWTPVEQDKDGNWVLKQKIEGVKMNIEISGSPPIAYDSTKEGTSSSPLSEFF